MAAPGTPSHSRGVTPVPPHAQRSRGTLSPPHTAWGQSRDMAAGVWGRATPQPPTQPAPAPRRRLAPPNPPAAGGQTTHLSVCPPRKGRGTPSPHSCRPTRIPPLSSGGPTRGGEQRGKGGHRDSLPQGRNRVGRVLNPTLSSCWGISAPQCPSRCRDTRSQPPPCIPSPVSPHYGDTPRAAPRLCAGCQEWVCGGGTPRAKPRGRGQGRIKASREKSQLHAPSWERGGKPPHPHTVRPSPSLAPTPRHIRGTPDPSGRGTGASLGGFGSSLRAPGLRGALGCSG